jgi:hypothetical protein
MGGADVTDVIVTCVSINTTLSVSTTGTIPLAYGTSTFTVTNTGTNTAFNVHAVLPTGWTGVTQNSSNCAAIPPNNGTCALVFSSTTPYVAQGGILITGDNITSPPTTAFAFKAVNNQYLIWSVSSTSVKIIDTEDLPQNHWSSNYVATGAISYTNGVSNTLIIQGTPGVGADGGAAGNCYNSNNGGVTRGNWYLPAICEMGPSGEGAGCGAGQANIISNLVSLGFGGLTVGGDYWTSTEYSGFPSSVAWYEFVVSNGNSAQFGIDKKDFLDIRCARVVPFSS